MYNYKAKIERVVDGDTVYATIDLGFFIKTTIDVRLSGINTPELNSKDPIERENANKAKDKLKELIEGKEVFMKSYKKDKYGRWLGEFFLTENSSYSVNQQMITEGLAVRYV